jgi:hypothetical protein
MDLFLNQTVYHKDIYDGKEQMKIIGIREKEVELEGDYSGGTHNVCQKAWHSIDGVIIKDESKYVTVSRDFFNKLVSFYESYS